MRDNAALAVSITLTIAIGVAGISVFGGLWLRRRLYHRGPAWEAWELTRRGLSASDRWHVRRATSRKRPVDRGGLAPAQLVFTRYSQDVAGRSPANRRWFRVAYALIALALAALQFVNGAVTQHPAARWFDVAFGCYWIAMGVLFAWWLTRYLGRYPQRMKLLRREIRQRYPDDWA